MKTKCIQFLTIPVLWFFLSCPLYAATIFSTFGPDYSFSNVTYRPINFYTSPEVVGASLAFRFEVPIDSDYRLSEVLVAASWVGTKKNASFSLFADVSGLPADLPAAMLAENPAALTELPAIVSLPVPNAFMLASGKPYWLVIEPSSLDISVPADDAVHLWLNPEASVVQTSRRWFPLENWTDWYSPPFIVEAPAFSVKAVPVPLPDTLFLFLSGATLLWVSVHCQGRRAGRDLSSPGEP